MLLASRWLSALGVVLGVASTCSAENWPNWRGPRNNGISGEKSVPVKWSATENVAWHTKLPGPAGASPVVWGDNIFLTSADGAELVLLCYGTDGKQRWREVIGSGNKDVRGDEGNSASNSPVTDGKFVWAMLANGQLTCHTVAGKEIWKLNLEDRYGKFDIQFGMTSTPILDEDKLYLQLIHGKWGKEPSRGLVVCLDAATGKELWKQVRATDAVDENKHSYASPMMYDYGGRKLLLTHGADYTIAHDPANGSEIWRLGNLNVKEKYDNTLRFVASPACTDGLIIVPTAKGGPCVAIRPDGKGDIPNDARVWTHAKTPDVPSPLVVGDFVYLCMQDGNIYCLDKQSGEQHYFQRTHRQRHRASPIYADGHIYLTARDGKVTVLKAGKEFAVVAENEVGDAISSSPAISNGTIYLRSYDGLWAIRNKQ